MKKTNFVRTICATFVLASLSVSLVHAENMEGTINVDSVPIVNSVNVDSEIVDIAIIDNTFEIKDTVDGFYEINYNGKNGYINTEFVDITAGAEIIQEEIAVAQRVDVSDLFAVIDATTLNVRSGATTDSEILGKVGNGTALQAVATISDGWTEVLYNDNTAFVSSEFIELMTEDEIPKLSDIRSEIVTYSQQFLGTPYVYGGTNLTSGVDCSGYVSSVFKNSGISLSRTSSSQINDGVRISKSELQPGDLVFFSYYGGTGVSHSGIYIGDNKFIHAASGSARRVIITDLNEDYYVKNYYGATRVL